MTSDWGTTLGLFAALTLLHLWGGAAIAAGLTGRRVLPLLWGSVIGAGPLQFGIERGLAFGSWAGLAWQAVCLALGAAIAQWFLPGWKRLLLRDSVKSLMIGMLLMAAGTVTGAFFFERGSEALSLIAGGGGFLLGAMWFGAGLQRLRGR